MDSESLTGLSRAVLAVLLDVTLKGALILALAGLASSLLRRSSAALRHLVWSLAVCSVLFLPVLTVALPSWQLSAGFTYPNLASVRSSAVPASSASLQEASKSSAAADALSSPDAAPPDVGTTRFAAPAQPGGRTPEALYRSVVSGFAGLFDAARATSWTVGLSVVWLTGFAGFLFHCLFGAAGVWWLAYRARPVRDAEWERLAGEMRARFLLRRPVRLLRSRRTAMPMTWGVLRPVVLLPVSARDWSGVRRRCVLLHEFAHIKRLDCLTQMLAQLACAANWFNPLVWMAARRMRHEREMACDDYVLDGGVRPSEYAANLLDLARITRSTLVVPPSAVAMARPSRLEDRVVSILERGRRRQALSRWTAWTGVFVAAGVVFPLAAMQPADPDLEGPEASEEARLAFRPVAAAQGEVYRWTGRVERGTRIEIRGLRGDVRAVPAPGSTVEVWAVFAGRPVFHTLQVVERPEGLTVCMPPPNHPGSCDAKGWDEREDAPEVSFLARIPEGVTLAVRTIDGDIRATALQGGVEAAAVRGDISVQATGFIRAEATVGDIELSTTAYGRAATVYGDIHARIGRTDWTGDLPFKSVKGDITVDLPADAHTDIDLRVEADGRLRSAIQLDHRSGGEGERFLGTLGRGGRRLSLHTVEGNITVTYAGDRELRAQPDLEIRSQDAGAQEAHSQVRVDAGGQAPLETVSRGGRSDAEPASEVTRTELCPAGQLAEQVMLRALPPSMSLVPR